MFLCGQMSGLAVIAPRVEASIDHTGLAVEQPSCSPTEQTVLSSVPLPSIPSRILTGSLGASNNCYYVECGLSWDNTVTLRWIAYSVLL